MNDRIHFRVARTMVACTLVVLFIGRAWPGERSQAAAPKNHKSRLAPGYTIPTVDISGEKQRQVIVDREPGQYLGHPTTVLLEDGRTMLIVYPRGMAAGRSSTNAVTTAA